jgi:hypothetical protein
MTAWMSVRKCAQGLLMAAAAVLASAQAQAYTVSLAPVAQTVETGALVAIDVRVSDLGSTGLGSYSLDLSFDAGILGFDHATDALNLGFAVGLFVTPAPGTLLLTDVSFDDPALLLTRQGDTVTLFTLYFNAVGLGTGTLGFNAGSAMADVFGDALTFLTTGATVTVTEHTEPGGVPIPGTLPLVLAAAFGAAAVRRRSVR